MKKPTSIKDVAQQAGVSVSTVSRVLSGHPYIKSETRQRVVAVIEQLDYHPHPVARSLRRRRTNLIGLIVSTIENVFFTEVARAAEQTALQYGYHLIVCNTDENPQQEEIYLRTLSQQMVAGIILAPAPGSGRHLLPYLDQELALILINRRLPELSIASITADDDEAAFQGVTWLVNEGRRRIAAITGLSGVYTTQRRLAGYRRALDAAGLPVDANLEVSGRAHLDGGYEATIRLMRQDAPPDALFVFNNAMTQGVVMALQDLGLCWPEQIDVAGFGAFKTAGLYRPPLTLIKQPAREMGRRAVELLVARLEGKSGSEPKNIVLSNQLILRETWLQYQGVFEQKLHSA
jgi:DNA-binding LacI/PurR family transcriptional regulator